MIDINENYKFDLGVKGFIILQISLYSVNITTAKKKKGSKHKEPIGG